MRKHDYKNPREFQLSLVGNESWSFHFQLKSWSFHFQLKMTDLLKGSIFNK